MSHYVQNFTSNEQIIEEYAANPDILDGATVHLAWYGYGCYCGDSLVVYETNEKLFVVHASHCSCFGLEGQWKPEETSWEALAMYNLAGDCEGGFEAQTILDHLIKQGIKAKAPVVKEYVGRHISEDV